MLSFLADPSRWKLRHLSLVVLSVFAGAATAFLPVLLPIALLAAVVVLIVALWLQGRPAFALGLLCVAAPLERLRAEVQIVLPEPFGLKAVVIVAALVFLAVVLRHASGFRSPSQKVLLFTGGYVYIAFLSNVVNGVELRVHQQLLFRVLSLLILYCAYVLTYSVERSEPGRATSLYVWGAVAPAALAYFQLGQVSRGEVPTIEWLDALAGSGPQVWFSPAFGYRVNGFFLDAAYLGTYLGTVLLVILARLLAFRSSVRAWRLLLVATVLLPPLFLTLERIVFLELAAAALVLFVLLRGWQSNQVKMRSAIVLAAAVLIVLVTPIGNLAVQRLLSDEAVRSDSFRLLFWQSALDLAARSPLIGSGLLSFEPLTLEGNPDAMRAGLRRAFAHSLYLDVLVETGLAGLGALLALFAYVARALSRAFSLQTVGSSSRVRLACLTAGLAALMAGNVVNQIFFAEFVAVYLGMALGVAHASLERPERFVPIEASAGRGQLL